MAAPTTKFKQLLFDAISTPQVKVFSTKAEAHKARFAMYDSMRKMRKEMPPDPYGEMKDVLEFLIKELPTGQAELRIQPKSTRLVECLDDWISEGPSTQPPSPIPAMQAPRPAPAPPVNLTALNQQLINETPKEIDPLSNEGAYLQLLMEIDDWLAHMADNVKFPHADANDLRKKIAKGELPRPTLQAFKDMVQDIAMRKAYKVPTPH